MEKFRTVKTKKHAAKHGFLKRSSTKNGRKVLKRRRATSRKRIA